MENVRFLLASLIETSSLLILTLTLSRLGIRFFKKEIIISATILTLVSFILIKINLRDISVGVQLILLIFIFRFLFKEKILSALWTTVKGYLTFIVIQAILLFVMIFGNLFTMNDLNDPFTLRAQSIQYGTALIVFLVCYIVYRSGDDISFSFHKSKFKSSRYLYISLAILAVMAIAVSFFVLFQDTYLVYLIGLFAILLTLSIILFALSIIQNRLQFNSQFKQQHETKTAKNIRKENKNETT